ncbi:leucine-rich repeat transmembrane protein kinase protein [Tanacetum coccineum]
MFHSLYLSSTTFDGICQICLLLHHFELKYNNAQDDQSEAQYPTNAIMVSLDEKIFGVVSNRALVSIVFSIELILNFFADIYSTTVILNCGITNGLPYKGEGSDYWCRVNITESTAMDYEIIHLFSSDNIYVCLVNIGLGYPFISALELRLLDSSMYATQLQSLILVERYSLGSSETVRGGKMDGSNNRSNQIQVGRYRTSRYPDDKYDRIWSPATPTSLVAVHTSGTVSSGSTNGKTADATEEYFVYLYIAEIETLKKKQKREFNIYLNEDYWDGPVSPLDHITSEYFTTCSSSLHYNFTLYPTDNSTLAPIYNAVELYNPKQFFTTANRRPRWLKRNWQGDPCLPYASAWDGINCSYKDSENPRIISLNMSSSGLSGEIADALANFTMINLLDPSYNNLTGSVPKFLASHDFLETLNLTGNNFTRPLPAELLAKSKKGSLLLIIEDISNQDKDMPSDIVGARNQGFTFLEIQSITDSFNMAIGKGGFRTVIYGSIGNNQVAVKMLSESSAQGYREFQAETAVDRNIDGFVVNKSFGLHFYLNTDKTH